MEELNLIKQIKNEFFKKLQSQPTWDKNQIIRLFSDIITDVLIEYHKKS